MIIDIRRFHRSTRAPAIGPMTIPGSREIKVAVAKIVAEPVVSVSHHTSANWTTPLPNREKACPVQMVKNLNFQSDVSESKECAII
jgi:hypothetical protein